MVIQRSNYLEVYKFASLAKKMGVDYIGYKNIFPVKKGDHLNEKEVGEVEKQLVQVLTELEIESNAKEMLNVYRYVYLFDNKGSAVLNKIRLGRGCKWLDGLMNVDSWGKVNICCVLTGKGDQYVVGDVRKDSVGRIWEGKEFSNIRGKIQNGSYLDICRNACVYCNL
ncbi:SPASM domain-containing protein [Patescibacteria group bacterium]|nr:SPASM domain-containing protein [Patescibacteria group bacterium]